MKMNLYVNLWFVFLNHDSWQIQLSHVMRMTIAESFVHKVLCFFNFFFFCFTLEGAILIAETAGKPRVVPIGSIMAHCFTFDFITDALIRDLQDCDLHKLNSASMDYQMKQHSKFCLFLSMKDSYDCNDKNKKVKYNQDNYVISNTKIKQMIKDNPKIVVFAAFVVFHIAFVSFVVFYAIFLI